LGRVGKKRKVYQIIRWPGADCTKHVRKDRRYQHEAERFSVHKTYAKATRNVNIRQREGKNVSAHAAILKVLRFPQFPD
jgi:hypothetical protein